MESPPPPPVRSAGDTPALPAEKGAAAESDERRPCTERQPYAPDRAALEALVREAGEGMLLADAEANILYANPACARLLGVPLDEILGRAGAELAAPAYLFMARAMMSRVLEEPGEPVSGQVEVRRADGESATLAVRVVNHLSTPGIEALVALVRPSTVTAEELADSYRALFDNALIGMGVADMQGNLLAFNDAMLEPGGYSREDIERIGNVAKLYANDADRPRVLQILRAQGYVWREPVPFVGKDGSAYRTLLTLTPVVFMGQPCLYATVEVHEGGP